jgi:hypothetical protein
MHEMSEFDTVATNRFDCETCKVPAGTRCIYREGRNRAGKPMRVPHNLRRRALHLARIEARRRAEESNHPCVSGPKRVVLVPLREGITSPLAAGKPHLEIARRPTA